MISISITDREQVAFLLGYANASTNMVVRVVSVTNSSRGARFVIDRREVDRVHGYALDNNLTTIGIFHCHPHGGTHPSEQDMRAMRGAQYIWLIAHVAAETLTCQAWSASGSPINLGVLRDHRT